MLSKKEKENIIKDFKIGEKDTGSTKIQIALLTENIIKLTEHCKENPKDFSTKRGLLKMVGQRRKFLKYLNKNNLNEYQEVIKKLKLKK